MVHLRLSAVYMNHLQSFLRMDEAKHLRGPTCRSKNLNLGSVMPESYFLILVGRGNQIKQKLILKSSTQEDALGSDRH